MADFVKPLTPIIAEMVASMDLPLRELYEERAGILEFDARLDRSQAEALALLEIIRRHGWSPKRQK